MDTPNVPGSALALDPGSDLAPVASGPVRVSVTREEVRAALAALDALARQALHPRGLAGLPGMFAMMMGLEEVPPQVAAMQAAGGAFLDASEVVTITVKVGGREVAELAAT